MLSASASRRTLVLLLALLDALEAVFFAVWIAWRGLLRRLHASTASLAVVSHGVPPPPPAVIALVLAEPDASEV